MEEFGRIGKSLLERALTMYLLALSARHVVLSLPPSQDYNLANQIGQALIYVLAHPAELVPCRLFVLPRPPIFAKSSSFSGCVRV